MHIPRTKEFELILFQAQLFGKRDVAILRSAIHLAFECQICLLVFWFNRVSGDIKRYSVRESMPQSLHVIEPILALRQENLQLMRQGFSDCSVFRSQPNPSRFKGFII